MRLCIFARRPHGHPECQEGHGKNIFVSFVVVHTSDLYAMVYIRGVSHFDTTTVFAKIKKSLDGQAKLIKFPNDAGRGKIPGPLAEGPDEPCPQTQSR